MTTFDADGTRIHARIVSVGVGEAGLPPAQAIDVAFHMTDWLADLAELVDFYSDPASLSPEEVHRLLIQFLVHVPNHLAAAATLYAKSPVTDVFGVKAVGLAQQRQRKC